MYIDRLGRNAAVNLHSQYYTKGVKRTTTEKLNIKEIKDKTPKSIVLKLIPKKRIKYINYVAN